MCACVMLNFSKKERKEKQIQFTLSINEDFEHSAENKIEFI